MRAHVLWMDADTWHVNMPDEPPAGSNAAVGVRVPDKETAHRVADAINAWLGRADAHRIGDVWERSVNGRTWTASVIETHLGVSARVRYENGVESPWVVGPQALGYVRRPQRRMEGE